MDVKWSKQRENNDKSIASPISSVTTSKLHCWTNALFTPQAAVGGGHKQPPLSSSLMGFYFSSKNNQNFPWKPSHRYHFTPKSTFPAHSPPWSCDLMPWRQSPVPALVCWGCDGDWKGILWDWDWNQSSFHQILFPSRIRQFCPGKFTQIRHHTLLHPSVCSWKRLENWKEWNFTPFPRWYFSPCFFSPPFSLLMVLGVSGLNRTWALNPGLSPEGQDLAWPLTPRIWQNKCKITQSVQVKLSQVVFRHWLFGVPSLLQTRQCKMVFGDKNITRRAKPNPCWGCFVPSLQQTVPLGSLWIALSALLGFQFHSLS